MNADRCTYFQLLRDDKPPAGQPNVMLSGAGKRSLPRVRSN